MSGEWATLRRVVHSACQLLLAGLWLYLAWDRLQLYRSQLLTSGVLVQSFPMPALTVCPVIAANYTMRAALNNGTDGIKRFWRHYDPGRDGSPRSFLMKLGASREDLLGCEGASCLGTWRPLLTERGVCHTLQPPRLDAHDANDDGTHKKPFTTLTLTLQRWVSGFVSPNVGYKLFVHGENWPMVTWPSLISESMLIKESVLNYDFMPTYYLKMSREVTSSTERRPCTDSATYHQSLCLQRCRWRHTTDAIGCRGPWMEMDEPSICQTAEQLQAAADSDAVSAYRVTDRWMTQNCDCPEACTWSGFQVTRVLSRRNSHPKRGFVQRLSLNFERSVRVSTNTLLYDMPAMMSEVGGNAGLYLGFSLLTVLDGSVDLLEWAVRRKG